MRVSRQTGRTLLIMLPGIAFLVTAVCAFGALIWGITTTTPVSCTVVDKSWRRVQEIYVYRTVQRTGTHLPPDAELISESTTYEPRLTTDMDGYPSITHEWETKYVYNTNIWEWLYDAISSGTASTEPHWADVKLRSNEVIKSRTELYEITLGDPADSTMEVSYEEWLALPVGSPVIAYINRFGDVLSVQPAEAVK